MSLVVDAFVSKQNVDELLVVHQADFLHVAASRVMPPKGVFRTVNFARPPWPQRLIQREVGGADREDWTILPPAVKTCQEWRGYAARLLRGFGRDSENSMNLSQSIANPRNG